MASGFAILTMIVCTSAFAYPGEKYATHSNLSMHKTIGIALNARPGKVVSKELEHERAEAACAILPTSRVMP